MDEAEAKSRIDALEVRIAHQDRIIEELNTALTAQWKTIDGLTKQIERLADKMQQLDAGTAPSSADEAPPPHY
jgi:SlyX protein